jgi:hypothetical protein
VPDSCPPATDQWPCRPCASAGSIRPREVKGDQRPVLPACRRSRGHCRHSRSRRAAAVALNSVIVVPVGAGAGPCRTPDQPRRSNTATGPTGGPRAKSRGRRRCSGIMGVA